MPKDKAINSIEHDDRYIAIEDTFNALDSLDPDADSRQQRLAWPAIVASATQLLAEKPDLRVALWLTRALIETSGLEGLADGLERIAALTAKREGDADAGDEGQDSPALALAWLGLPEAALRIGKLTLESIQIDVSSAALRDDALRARLPIDAQALHWMSRSIDSLGDIEHAINIVETDYPLHTAGIRRLLTAASRQTVAATSLDTGTQSGERSTMPCVATDRAAIAHRIDELIEWFRRHEPGHPAPLLLNRVRRSMSMDFLELVEELMPDASNGLGPVFGNHRETQA